MRHRICRIEEVDLPAYLQLGEIVRYRVTDTTMGTQRNRPLADGGISIHHPPIGSQLPQLQRI